MNTKKLFATLLVAGMLLTGCGLKNSQAIIKINDSTITQKDFDTMLDKQIAMSPFAKIGMGDIKQNKNGVFYLMTERAVVTQLVVQNILDQEAKARGIRVSNRELNSAIDKVIDQLGGKDRLSALLKQNNVTIADFKNDMRNQVKMEKLARSVKNVKVSDKEAKDFYNKNIDKFKHGEQVRASHILLSADPIQVSQEIASSSKKQLSQEELTKRTAAKIKENEALANKLSSELKLDNSKFAAYAKKYSQDQGSAQKGGDLGFFEAKAMVPEFSKAAFAAKPNTVIGPVRSQFGYHIILVVDRKPAGIEPFNKVKNNLKQNMQGEKELKALDEIVNAAKKKSKIVYLDKQYDPEEITKKLNTALSGMQKNANRQQKPVKK
ncbi:MAG TPA: hypothetical protein DEO94_06305 [Cyanobacteria bacterium UBA11991]|nr:peptidylprolyl isomerase [Cyanobacteriota bacterium]MDY6359178.1 peptidylprolyl isomerase [Cyanobacteriota bacterium]MDY6364499.1 peptidylprolyl isomerase [Cyanobacteriota bacterium]MDY6383143.1 peptidylprolyl isomerase [Cyanobacteriota bacterium]HCB11725.1 hypothetical protein [Cyanobacteria bacterium UBA11991]